MTRHLQRPFTQLRATAAATTMQLPFGINSIARSGELRRRLLQAYPWVMAPLVINAPMRILAGPEVAAAVTSAGGLGFIGPNATPADMHTDLETAAGLLSAASKAEVAPLLPVGIGFQVWNGNVTSAAEIVGQHRPCAAWLFAPGDGQSDVDEWAVALREASPGTQIWLQVGTLSEAVAAAGPSNSTTAPDVLVIQGSEAGGHGRDEDSSGTMALFPEVADALMARNIPLVAAGGIIDGRGVAAAHGLGAAGAVMGTRFLASTEARIAKGYQDEVVRASDGAVSTVRTQLYNNLRGTLGWPIQWSPRGIINRSWIDYKAGVPFEELKKLHNEAVAEGDAAWGPEGRTATYASVAVGLVRSVDGAGSITETARSDAKTIIEALTADF